jgi:hypothetical protein
VLSVGEGGAFVASRQLLADDRRGVVLLFGQVNADAALTISWRRVDVVAGQIHVGLILALCGSLAILLTTPSLSQGILICKSPGPLP